MLHARHPSARAAASPILRSSSVIPFDYAASFALTGRPGNVLQDAVNVSPDGVFVATAIGYGFEEERGRGLAVDPQREDQRAQNLPAPPVVLPGDLALGQIPVSALLEGVRLNPPLRPLFFRTDAPPGDSFSAARITGLADQLVPGGTLAASDRGGLFQRVKPPEELSFLFSVIDSGTGRELQDEPTHNLASLGKTNGERPFRPLAMPLTFQPRSSIRVQVIERSVGVRGTLQIVFYGYKLLGLAACPEPVMRELRGSAPCPVETIGWPDARVVPFDYVATFPLAGQPQNTIDREIAISTDGGFVVTNVGYGLLVEETGVPIEWSRVDDLGDQTLRAQVAAFAPTAANDDPDVDLNLIPLRLLPLTAWLDGFRIKPDMARLALRNNGALADALPAKLADEIFERLNRGADVSFRYQLFDGGRGRELQNRPLHNVAGLGIATGKRPFKRLARAAAFLPRSTLRVSVEEQFGRGTLFLTFQGYKLLGPAARNERRTA